MRRPVTVLDAPSNLGLRPPVPGAVPGAYKLGWALREQGVVRRLGANDAGVVIPPRYRDDWDGRTLRNREAIVRYTGRLAERVGRSIDGAGFLVVLGGDCSILLGPALALRRRGRHGLVFIDGHTDFRHPGNSEAVGAAAGEDLALVTGRGSSDVTNIGGLGPYVQDQDAVAVGFRADDEYAAEALGYGIGGVSASAIRGQGARSAADRVVQRMEGSAIEGFWIHLDVDVLDSTLMPAVDSPEPDGLTFAELSGLLQGLTSSRLALGMDVTVFDPDLDEESVYARPLADALVAGLTD